MASQSTLLLRLSAPVSGQYRSPSPSSNPPKAFSGTRPVGVKGGRVIFRYGSTCKAMSKPYMQG